MLRTPAGRIAVALAVSALLHLVLLWLPDVALPRFEPGLPPLSAKLQPLPKLAPHAARPRQHPAKPSPKPAAPEPTLPQKLEAASAIPAEAMQAASSIPAETAQAASGVPAEAVQTASGVSTAPDAASSVAATVDYTQTSELAPILPKHAQLRFAAYLGTSGLYVGEMRHDLEISDRRYSLHAELETAGLARLVKRYQIVQNSRGALTGASSLQPGEFTEERTDGHGTQRFHATFDWSAHELSLANGAKTALPEGAQDILSLLYQLSQLPYDKAVIPLAVSNGKKLESYRLEVGEEEEIATPMGKLRALHLRKMRGPNEEGLEIWLGMEYRLLPVKFRQIERNGDIAGEIVIKEIRVADE